MPKSLTKILEQKCVVNHNFIFNFIRMSTTGKTQKQFYMQRTNCHQYAIISMRSIKKEKLI